MGGFTKLFQPAPGPELIDYSGFWVTVLYEYKKTGNTFTDSNGDTAIEFISQDDRLYYRVKPSDINSTFKDEVREAVNGAALDGRVR